MIDSLVVPAPFTPGGSPGSPIPDAARIARPDLTREYVASGASYHAATVPLALTQRGGGPLAVKPSEDPNLLVPLAQVYLVEIEVTDPDIAIDPGQLAVVKIHAKWRSSAWWVGRAIANALDIGLY